MKREDLVSYRYFSTLQELQRSIQDDLMLLSPDELLARLAQWLQ